MRRQQSVQAKLASFLLRERRTFMQSAEEIHSATDHRQASLHDLLVILVSFFLFLMRSCASYGKRLILVRPTMPSPRPLTTTLSMKSPARENWRLTTWRKEDVFSFRFP